MNLSEVIVEAMSIARLNEIFVGEVNVQLGWVNDSVTIEGYEGAITTDFIAYRVLNLSGAETEDSKRLANLLEEKVFTPLKILVESPENQYSLYQLIALTRVGWTPPQSSEFGSSWALKHAMVLGLLDRKYANW